MNNKSKFIMAATCLLLSCNKEPKIPTTDCDNNIKLAYSIGWIDGANALIEMRHNGIISNEKIESLHIADSLNFSNHVDKTP